MIEPLWNKSWKKLHNNSTETEYNRSMNTMNNSDTKRIYIIIRKDDYAFIDAYDNLTQARSMQRHFRVPTEIITKEFARDTEACSI